MVGETLFVLHDFLSPFALQREIYITQAYQDLAEIIVARLDEDNTTTPCGIMASGTPGIGKSCFLPFLMLYELVSVKN